RRGGRTGGGNMSRFLFARESLLENIEDARDLAAYAVWLKSARETVRFEELVSECGFSEEDL
ncbi:MAG TPA: hypothetical protein P5201_15460, partial [Aminobacteriaceae bacterium]|nr:hypothetical protein [Aminobacteriaceae bacterium]